MQAIEDDVDNFLRREAVPNGHKYTLVLVSTTKRALAQKIPASYRLQFLEHLEKMTKNDGTSWGNSWLTDEMIAAVEPMPNRGEEIAAEIRKLDPLKALDVYASYFTTFAKLNPSLIAALKLSPSYRRTA
jgi:hypothetical protein